jgi:hypothetical protein
MIFDLVGDALNLYEAMKASSSVFWFHRENRLLSIMILCPEYQISVGRVLEDADISPI